eukprot:TRINITY_DN12927_c0_g1_i1.p1 TRINITY_DN12927_c0_g1~~TRINITY_DN12927_c0_g1_i1.p1  ORF type:complete len:535 (-),score=193.72 TRINITY_DN12927_c0_g1_i1:183-1688(-)
MDRQVADLERETRTAVLTAKGPYASNAADQVRDEAAALSREIENSLGTVVEEKNNMASFLDEMRVQFGEIVTETLKMEEFMGQYGFKSNTPVNLDDMLNWDAPEESLAPAAASEFGEELIENVEEPADMSIHETDTITSMPVANPKSKTPLVQPAKPSTSDSPNFFDVGLSSLAMELYIGKSVKPNQPKPRHEAPTANAANPEVHPKHKSSSGALLLPNSYVNKASPARMLRPQPLSAADFIQDDSIYAASPVLRLSSKLTQQSDLSNMSNMSNMSAMDSVDITPGLPSRKKHSAPVPSPPDTPITARLASVPADIDSPHLPELQTVNFAHFNWQQSSSASPDLPVKLQYKPPARPTQATPELPRMPPNCDTPELPDLQTMDIRKLVKDSAPVRMVPTAEPSLLTREIMSNVSRENTPEEPQLTGHYNQLKHLNTHLTSMKENTPEEPQLTSQYNYQPHLANASPLPKKNTPELPELSIMQERPARTQSPETPVLSFNFRK